MQLQYYIAPLAAIFLAPLLPILEDYRPSSPSSIFQFDFTVKNVVSVTPDIDRAPFSTYVVYDFAVFVDCVLRKRFHIHGYWKDFCNYLQCSWTLQDMFDISYWVSVFQATVFMVEL